MFVSTTLNLIYANTFVLIQICFSSQDVQSLPIVKSTHECVQDININSGRLNSATCKEQHKFVPFSRNDAGVNTHSTQTLTFKRESSVMSQSGKLINESYTHHTNSKIKKRIISDVTIC